MISAPAKRGVRKIPRAEPVGSLLRDPQIAAAIEAVYPAGACACRSLVLLDKPDELRALTEEADRAIPGLIQRQLDAGLDVVTDGEVRRPIFLSSFQDAVEGLGQADEPLEVRNSKGELLWISEADPIVDGRVKKVSSPLAEEVAFLRGLGDLPFKVTLPAPSYFYMSDWVPMSPGSGYGSRQDFVDDVVGIEQCLIGEAIAAGARWIQLDFPPYPALVDEVYVGKLDSKLDASALLERAIAADRRVVEHVPEGITLALHLCRGNGPGGVLNGSCEPIAERMFNELPYERFLVEWEDVEREGDYSPLRHVPAGKVIGLGLVSTKTPAVEADDEVVARIEQASQHLDLEQLALCSQCGFASVYSANLVEAENAQWRKLELIGRVADRVWGRA